MVQEEQFTQEGISHTTQIRKQKLHTHKKLTQVEQQQKGGELGEMDTAIASGTAKNPHLLCLSAPF